ncbi:MAG: malonyl-ACP O-methyltransferase BioC [Candidatus Omnitrophica bacterium]|nr:malonyl-ACP O-methyltransferase BioC [Candidatus Omnitrophota bacterium]
MIDKNAIKNNFSRYAPYYDRYSAVQSACAKELLSMFNAKTFISILDIGCGTGILTGLLSRKFPKASIKAVDISDGMIDAAVKKFKSGKIKFIREDAENMHFKQQFDLVASNAALQWFGDLSGTLSKYKDFLSPGGMIIFSTFGPKTFCELSKALRQIDGAGAKISADNFLKKRMLREILKGIFKKIKIEEKIFRERNHSIEELLNRIKYTGVRGAPHTQKHIWTKGRIRKLEKAYRNISKDMIATYQVFFCKGIK